MLVMILDIIFACALCLLLIYILPMLWAYLESSQTRQDRTDYVKTADGWRIAIHNYKPTGPVVGRPVILCHGIASNRFIFDLHNAPSLAEFLRTRNRDVWVAELRGSGCSERPGLLLSDRPLKWNFDDHLTYDMEAIVGHVTKQTGTESVHWIGHSMGGMLVQAYMSRAKSSSLASAIAIGSPTNFESMKNHYFRNGVKLRPSLGILPFNPIIPLFKCFAPFARLVPGTLSLMFSRNNIEWPVIRKIAAIGVELISSSALWQDMARFADSGKFSDPSGKYYLDGLEKSPTPLLVVCGTKDFMAPERAVLSSFTNGDADSPVRDSVVLGKKTGLKEGYGHIDLLLGSRAHEEVFPMVERWLSRWDGGDTTQFQSRD